MCVRVSMHGAFGGGGGVAPPIAPISIGIAPCRAFFWLVIAITVNSLSTSSSDRSIVSLIWLLIVSPSLVWLVGTCEWNRWHRGKRRNSRLDRLEYNE